MILVDPQDQHLLDESHWWVDTRGYVVRSSGKSSHESLHRVILNCPKGKVVDHANGDKQDNRRSNIRVCTIAENSRNVGLRKDNKTGYKGVYWMTVKKRYKAQIKVDGKRIGLGIHRTAEAAHEAYKAAAIKYHKEFAKY